MKKRKSGLSSSDAKNKSGLVLGQERFAKISAVEGIVLTTSMKKRMAGFDRKKMPAEARRESIIRAYRKG
jgi:hypothetical protein